MNSTTISFVSNKDVVVIIDFHKCWSVDVSAESWSKCVLRPFWRIAIEGRRRHSSTWSVCVRKITKLPKKHSVVCEVVKLAGVLSPVAAEKRKDIVLVRLCLSTTTESTSA